MKLSDLKPASQLAQRFGVKSILYGPPGTGKTPITKTAPRPVMLVTEPGMLTMRDCKHIPAWDGFTPARIDEFVDWIKNSSDAKNFDTLCCDSISQMAEIYLADYLTKFKDGRKAYGEMSRHVMKHLNDFYYMPNKHTYLIAKEGMFEIEGGKLLKPYFPGQELNVQVPHMYDEVWRAGLEMVPGQPQPVVAIRTKATFGKFARDRSGQLDELEFPDLSQLFKKAMA